jgi:nucleoid-associated protein YgaU
MAAAKIKGATPSRLSAAVQTKDAMAEANEQSKMAASKQQNEKSKSELPVAQIEVPGPQQPRLVNSPDFDTIESNLKLEAALLQMQTKRSGAVQKPQLLPEAIMNADIVQGQLAIKRIRTYNGHSIGSIQVEVEETLGHYAEWLEVSASEIRRLNGLRFGRPLRINQSIKIPLQRVTKEDFEEKRFEFHKELAEDFFASFRVEKVETYTVRRGDSIWTISKEKFDVPLWLIKKYNIHLDFSELQPAQKLNIPIIQKNQV